MVSDVDMWLPISEKFICVAKSPLGYSSHISTVSLLKQELDELNQQIWKADEATILSWSQEKYYVPIKPKGILGIISRVNKKEKYSTEDLAQCAYSMLYQAVNFALKHKVPIILDYL